MSSFKVFFVGFSLVMGFMTVSISAQADQACVQECLAEGLATPATKRKIATGVLTRPQLVKIMTRQCDAKCAQAEPAPEESEPTAAYQPPIVADSDPNPEPPAQPEAEGTDGGEATDDADAGEIAPIEPETMPAIDVPDPTDGFLKTSLEVQSQLADKVDTVVLEDLLERVSALEEQLAAQSEIHSTREDEPTYGIDPADTVAEAVPVEPETPDTSSTPVVNSEVVVSDMTIVVAGGAVILLIVVALFLNYLLKLRRQKKLENARQAEAADEDEDMTTFEPLPSEPPPIGGGAAPTPPRLPSDRIVIGNPVEFRQPPIPDPDL